MPNRLIHESSPYLLQHAHNPVDWFPWGEEALGKAKKENKVILVSIGYSACHWCHVMERESFENEATAGLMNEYFVNIKIDREERPDLDHVYMDAVQMLSGQGGWPLNVFLTPEAKPFYGGTYFPPVKAYNRSSWTDVINAIHMAWLDKPEELLGQAESLTSHLEKSGLFDSADQASTGFDENDLRIMEENLMRTADTAWGGFGNAPKFPQTFSISFLLRQAWFAAGQVVGKEPSEKILHSPLVKQALLSLDKMIMGGIYDQLGGGFARYSTDAQWLAPHFEKMLYDNALLIGVISEAFQLTGKEIYREVIEQTMQFIREEWQDADGGFFSAFDADSEGVEGKYYTWGKEELQEIIEDPEAFEIFTAYYGVTEEGNWEHTNILWIPQPLEIFCRARGIEPGHAKHHIDNCRKLLLHRRKERIKPLLDDKKLLGWNGLMITSCCKAWAATGNHLFLEMAEKAAGFIESGLKSVEGKYHHNYKNGKASNPAFLDDLAAYIEALGYLQESTGNMQYLETALRLINLVIGDFLEDDGLFFYYTPGYQHDIIIRKKEFYDGATPSGNSIMARNLLYFGTLVDKPGWIEHSVALLTQLKKLTVTYPGSFGNWAQIVQSIFFGLKEIAVVGPGYKKLGSEILKIFLPNKVFQQAATGSERFPLLKNKVVDGKSTEIFLCENFSCRTPVKNLKDFLEMINRG
jgi:uncharacterized protein YyaL (SSP411 family)